MNLHLTKSYFRFIKNSKHKKGYGLHSPFMFNLVREIMYGKQHYYAFDAINNYRTKLSRSKETIQTTNFGNGSQVFKLSSKKISQLNKHSSIPAKYGELLFKIVNHYQPQNIIELGTSIGISTAYLSLANTKSTIHTIEGCKQTSDFAKNTFQELNCTNINQHTGHFDEQLPKVLKSLNQLDLAFIDGNHNYAATIDYFKQCLHKTHNNSILVFDDIYWSEEMTQAWQEIVQHEAVTVSIDLFRLGIVFFRKECQKQHFIITY